MKRFSAQYIFTNAGPPLKRGLITAGDDGSIVKVEDTGGSLSESHLTEFHNGIIVPGFVNCHCHLELSHLKGIIPAGKGLGNFIIKIRAVRDSSPDTIVSAAAEADKQMYGEGIVLCADICNMPATFDIKNKSRITYINLIEVFGIDPAKAGKRIGEAVRLSAEADRAGLSWSIIPHSLYSVSLPLFRLLREKTADNLVTSIHFMETGEEKVFLSHHTGLLRDSYEASGLLPDKIQLPDDHSTAILSEVTSSGNLILVHNTFADGKTIKEVQKRKNTFWCICPNSNEYIENKLPPVDLLKSENCDIVTGTDSLASNRRLSILEELKTIQHHFQSVTLEEMIRWATLNGARALGMDNIFGSIKPGKKPGLVLLENVDLQNIKLLTESRASLLI